MRSSPEAFKFSPTGKMGFGGKPRVPLAGELTEETKTNETRKTKRSSLLTSDDSLSFLVRK